MQGEDSVFVLIRRFARKLHAVDHQNLTTRHLIRAPCTAEDDGVGARPAVEFVISFAAIYLVIIGFTKYIVITAFASQCIKTRSTDNDIVVAISD